MKLYAYTKKNDYICGFDATMEKDKYNNLYKEFKKLGLVQMANLRVKENDEASIRKAVEKLNFDRLTEIEVYPETFKLVKMPYKRESGLDKIGGLITYYQVEIAICTMPGLYYLIFDDEENVREHAIKNIWYYLNEMGFYNIMEEFGEFYPFEDVFDYRPSEEEKLDLIDIFLKSLDITLSDAIVAPFNATVEANEAFYLNEIVTMINKTKAKKHESKLVAFN